MCKMCRNNWNIQFNDIYDYVNLEFITDILFAFAIIFFILYETFLQNIVDIYQIDNLITQMVNCDWMID